MPIPRPPDFSSAHEKWVIRPIRRDATKNSVNGMNVSVLAGMVSTGIFAVGYLPMLLKALLVTALPERS